VGLLGGRSIINTILNRAQLEVDEKGRRSRTSARSLVAAGCERARCLARDGEQGGVGKESIAGMVSEENKIGGGMEV
jgi:hypothetical protein